MVSACFFGRGGRKEERMHSELGCQRWCGKVLAIGQAAGQVGTPWLIYFDSRHERKEIVNLSISRVCNCSQAVIMSWVFYLAIMLSTYSWSSTLTLFLLFFVSQRLFVVGWAAFAGGGGGTQIPFATFSRRLCSCCAIPGGQMFLQLNQVSDAHSLAYVIRTCIWNQLTVWRGVATLYASWSKLWVSSQLI